MIVSFGGRQSRSNALLDVRNETRRLGVVHVVLEDMRGSDWIGNEDRLGEHKVVDTEDEAVIVQPRIHQSPIPFEREQLREVAEDDLGRRRSAQLRCGSRPRGQDALNDAPDDVE